MHKESKHTRIPSKIDEPMATENKYIAVSYELRIKRNGDWKLWETATADEPFLFISGMGMTLDDFEASILPLSKGDKFDFTLTPAQAYGDYVEEAVQTVRRSVFEIDGRLNGKYIYEGAVVPLQNSDGERFNGTITRITDTDITVDLNHPLAGQSLHFKGQVETHRTATNTEIEEMATMLSNEGCCGCEGSGCVGCGSGRNCCDKV